MLVNEYPVISVEFPVIEISGNSIPEDADEFWEPFVYQFEGYCDNWPEIRVDFKFDFYNTRTLFWLMKLFSLLQKTSGRVPVQVNWFYLEADEDMQEIGENFKNTMKLNIKLKKR
jgi:hypothetical protein